MAKRTSRNGFYPSSFCPSLVSFLSPLFALWIRNVITVGKLGKGKRGDERTRIPRILATLLRRRSRFAILQSALSERYFCMEKEGFSKNVILREMEFESIAGTNKFWRVDLLLEIVLLVCRHVLRNLLKPPFPSIKIEGVEGLLIDPLLLIREIGYQLINEYRISDTINLYYIPTKRITDKIFSKCPSV